MNRLTKAIRDLSTGDIEGALLSIVTLIDASAKKMYHDKKVGRRFRRLLDEKQRFLYWIMSLGNFRVPDGVQIRFCQEDGDTFRSKSFSELIYDPLRKVLVHEAKFPTDVRIVQEVKFGYEKGVFIFPMTLVYGLLFMLICLPCNNDLHEGNCIIRYFGHNIDLSKYWGDEKLLISEFEKDSGKKYT